MTTRNELTRVVWEALDEVSDGRRAAESILLGVALCNEAESLAAGRGLGSYREDAFRATAGRLGLVEVEIEVPDAG